MVYSLLAKPLAGYVPINIDNITGHGYIWLWWSTMMVLGVSKTLEEKSPNWHDTMTHCVSHSEHFLLYYPCTLYSIIFKSMFHSSYLLSSWVRRPVPGKRKRVMEITTFRATKQCVCPDFRISSIYHVYIFRVYIKQPQKVSSLWGFPYLPLCFRIPYTNTRTRERFHFTLLCVSTLCKKNFLMSPELCRSQTGLCEIVHFFKQI